MRVSLPDFPAHVVFGGVWQHYILLGWAWRGYSPPVAARAGSRFLPVRRYTGFFPGRSAPIWCGEPKIPFRGAACDALRRSKVAPPRLALWRGRA